MGFGKEIRMDYRPPRKSPQPDKSGLLQTAAVLLVLAIILGAWLSYINKLF